ncbi:MAG TPA: hypothetical protein PKH60_04620 [Candidatus Woesebacteria bacterium]|nr:hypothetical protein [Candidatus Woesebacteria bacterium]
MLRLTMQTIISDLVQTIFDPSSIWSVVARGAIWFVIAAVIIVSVDSPNPNQSFRRMKSNLGFLVLFLVLSGTLMYMLFGYTKSA